MKFTQKSQAAFLGGIPVSVPNEVWQNCADFYVSYSASSRDYGCPTTTLVLEPYQRKFYILCGDHRKQYEEAKTRQACLAYFASHPELQHSCSDKL